ncbi:MAG: putative rhamnosyl transferase [Verrucomicrobiales bacterium]|nr:putative rhamnosyl transferase [Verrucomicrobiales bacterium]
MSRVLFSTLGSLGDLHPLIAMGIEMRNRGHSIGFATSEGYRHRIEALEFAFHPVRPDVAIDSPAMAPVIKQIMNPRSGPEVFLRKVLFPELRNTYDDLLRAATDGKRYDLMVTGEGIYAAPLVAEKTKIPWASTVCAPFSFFSAADPPVLPPCPRFSQWLYRFGPSMNRFVVRMIKRATRNWSKPVSNLRAELGLPCAQDPIHEGRHSPRLVLAAFSRVLGAPQPDWPQNTLITGYPFYDSPSKSSSAKLKAFLESGEPPIIFTLGSAAVFDPGQFYVESIKAALLLRKRAILLVGANAMPSPLPPGVFACNYLPFSEVLPHAAAVVHQGGAGTLGQTLRAGKPMLIMPYSHDQPDNAARAVKLGVARIVSRKRYKSRHVAKELQELLSNQACSAQLEEVRKQVQSENGSLTAADALERLLR